MSDSNDRNVVGPVPVGTDLRTTVGNLVRTLKAGAHSMAVYVADSRLVGVQEGKINGLPLLFVTPGQFPGLAEEDMVLLTYSEVLAGVTHRDGAIIGV